MATDYFQLLQLPRQPWLEEDQVRGQFQSLAGASHPDSGQGDAARFVALNQAWQTLRSPTARLRHYLELTHPEAVQFAGASSAANADLFMEIAEAQQLANALATKLGEAKSPLTRALLESERVAARKRLETAYVKVSAQSDALHQRLRQPAHPAEELAMILSQLVFLEKWGDQLRERLLSLA